MRKRSLLIFLCVFGILGTQGCTCFVPRTGFVAWETNHELVESFDQLATARQHAVICTVTQYNRWARRPFSIANTADCQREVKLTASIDQPLAADPDRKEIVITYREYDPIGIEESPFNLTDLFVGDQINIAYDLDDGQPANIVVMMNRQTNAANRERRRIQREEEWEKQKAKWREQGLIDR